MLVVLLCDVLFIVSPQALLLAQTPTIVKALHKQLKDKSTKTRQVGLLYVCIMYIHVCTYVCESIKMFMCVCICVCACVCMCTCVYVYVHMRV